MLRKSPRTFLAVACCCVLCLLNGASALASGSEQWTSQIPQALKAAFTGPQWEGYTCVDGFAFYPVDKPSGEYSSNIAFLIMRKDKAYTFCVLQQEYDEWQWRAKAEKLLPYDEDAAPVITVCDDLNWVWIEYELANGYREELTFVRFDGLNWYLGEYRKYCAKEPIQEEFQVRLDVEKYFGLCFDLTSQYYGDRKKRVDEFKAIVNDHHEFFVTKRKNGRLLYDQQPFYGILDLDINTLDIAAFPRTIEAVLERFSATPADRSEWLWR